MLEQLPSPIRHQMINLSKLHTHLGTDFMAQLGTTYREQRSGHQPGRHNAHRGWKAPHKRKFDRNEKHR
jgi:hypothetical protein